MYTSEDPRKAELIGQVVSEARKRVAPENAGEVERFIRRYFALVAPDDIIYTKLETLLGGALSLWEFGRERAPDTAKLRLLNPSPDREGWDTEHTVVEMVNDDMPFLVDSLTADFALHDRLVHLIIHPIVLVRRDADGRRIDASLDPDQGQEFAESYMHIEIDQKTDAPEIEVIRSRIEKVLADVRSAVTGWPPMRRKLAEVLDQLDRAHPPVPADELEESKEFLRWLDDENFVFLGYREYRFITENGNDYLQLVPESGLGLLRAVRPESAERGKMPFSAEFSQFARRKEILIVAKANNRSTVHRSVHMDRVSVKEFDDNGRLIGEHRFLGLFTSAAYARSVKFIPMLRRKANRIIERAGLGATSHAGKAL
ncbi:MAG TPA: NAD-glutamate dehydrogenase, partial [Thermoanaerobaculia bacterium]|nr:NAD-glutamate dehydrogenase [Thermoanaerobaculia bacterium]